MAIPLYGLGVTYLLWVHYVLVMAFRRAIKAGTMRRPAFVLGIVPALIGGLLDVLVNLMVCTVLLVELPRLTLRGGLRGFVRDSEWLVTARLTRHKRLGGWRGRISAWICSNLLDAFDPDGCHCG